MLFENVIEGDMGFDFAEFVSKILRSVRTAQKVQPWRQNHFVLVLKQFSYD